MRTQTPTAPALERPLGTIWNPSSGVAWHSGCYAGLPIHADSVEVHERALALLEEHAGRTDRVLDVGAGSGAFSKRLLDHGYSNVEALELRRDAFQVPEAPVHVLDLNGCWASRLPIRFDALVALEVFEHLENPWHFARQCADSLVPGGVAVVSTPNIESTRSRLEFLLRGQFRFFGAEDFEANGHITSMTADQIGRVFAQAGMPLVERRHTRHKGIPRPGNPKKALRALLYALSYPFMSGAVHGEVSLFVFRRSGGRRAG